LTLNWDPGSVLGGPNAFLVDQAEILADTIFCDRGDSGALVLDGNEPTAVGLLWGRNKAGAFAPGRFSTPAPLRSRTLLEAFLTIGAAD
jgi:hypothetical protein